MPYARANPRLTVSGANPCDLAQRESWNDSIFRRRSASKSGQSQSSRSEEQALEANIMNASFMSRSAATAKASGSCTSRRLACTSSGGHGRLRIVAPPTETWSR